MVSVIENLKEELREDMKITTDKIMKRLDTIPDGDGKRIDDVEGELIALPSADSLSWFQNRYVEYRICQKDT